MLEGVPSVGVGGGVSVGGGKSGLGEADSAVVAVGRAHGPLASHALVSVEALALAGLAVARSLVGALDVGVSIVGLDGNSGPGEALGAGAEGAVVLGPGGVAVGAVVAGALICGERCGGGFRVRTLVGNTGRPLELLYKGPKSRKGGFLWKY